MILVSAASYHITLSVIDHPFIVNTRYNNTPLILPHKIIQTIWALTGQTKSCYLNMLTWASGNNQGHLLHI